MRRAFRPVLRTGNDPLLVATRDDLVAIARAAREMCEGLVSGDDEQTVDAVGRISLVLRRIESLVTASRNHGIIRNRTGVGTGCISHDLGGG